MSPKREPKIMNNSATFVYNHQSCRSLRTVARELMETFSKFLTDSWFAKLMAGAVQAFFVYALGSHQANRTAFVAAGVLLIFDTITGLVAAAREGHLSSRGFSRFLVKGLVYMSVIIVAGEMTKIVPGLSPMRDTAIGAVIAAIGVTEGISILENSLRLGWNVPEPLRSWIQTRLTELRAHEQAEKQAKLDKEDK